MTVNYSDLPKSRKEAFAAGVKRYFTGKPCHRGHITTRERANSNCSSCLNRANSEREQTKHGRALKSGRNRRYYQSESGNAVVRANVKKRKILSDLSTPKWVDEAAIIEFYSHCPSDHHVDHILPVTGSTICGLSVLENLQYLPARSNLKKSNKVIPITLEYAVCPITTSGTME